MAVFITQIPSTKTALGQPKPVTKV
jgi:hypothetical protein